MPAQNLSPLVRQSMPYYSTIMDQATTNRQGNKAEKTGGRSMQQKYATEVCNTKMQLHGKSIKGRESLRNV